MSTEKTTLYFTQGSSDKMYMANIEESGDGYVVNFAYGRRGATLKTGTKTSSPVNYEAAKKIYQKLVSGKKAKGYTVGEDGVPYTDSDVENTGIICQLLNFITENEVTALIKDDAWWAQEKFDGKRMLIRKQDDIITAINRKGLSTGVPEIIAETARSLDLIFIIDGEAVGERLFVFDLLNLEDNDITEYTYGRRLAILASLTFSNPAITIIETAKTTKEKQKLFDGLKASGAEGIVFKKHSAPYTPGRPNSGGTQLKFKFYETATVIVLDINLQRSVAIGVLSNGKWEPVGNVAIPPNKEIPNVNSVVEVRYLYAYKDGSLYQPIYLGERDDMEQRDCVISQLKYKKES